MISWETNDPAGAEIRVSTGTDDEKLVTQGGPSGHVEIPWINDSKVYEFRLYVASSPEAAIDSVKARREIEVCSGRAPRNCRRSQAAETSMSQSFLNSSLR